MRQFGPRDHIYALGPRGISYLKTFAGWDKLYLSRAHKATSLPHRTTHGGNMAAFERSCLDMADQVRLIDTWEILDRLPGFKGPPGWDVNVPWKGEHFTIRLQPDHLGGIEFLKVPEGKNRLHFVVETDLGTENEVRTNWHGTQTSILRKLIPYLETRLQELLIPLFSIRSFKVFFIVNGEARIERIIRKCPEVDSRLRHSMFLFCTHEMVQKGNVLTLPWTNMDGQSVFLMP
jgi:hypothetical protein